MRTLLQLAATLLLTGATATSAQITNPDKLVAPAPRPPQIRQRPTEDDIQWLWQYAKPAPIGNKHDLIFDARFTNLLRDNLTAPQAFWGIGTPLSQAARTFLGGSGEVAATDNRYLAISGCVVDHCEQRGLLWVDLGTRDPLIVFAGLRWNEENKIPGQADAPFTLWLFPARQLDPHQLPAALKQALSSWSESRDCVPYQIASAIVVDPTGVPHVIGSIEAGVQPTVCTRSTGTHS
jgi:hypothetical protein